MSIFVSIPPDIRRAWDGNPAPSTSLPPPAAVRRASARRECRVPAHRRLARGNLAVPRLKLLKVPVQDRLPRFPHPAATPRHARHRRHTHIKRGGTGSDPACLSAAAAVLPASAAFPLRGSKV